MESNTSSTQFTEDLFGFFADDEEFIARVNATLPTYLDERLWNGPHSEPSSLSPYANSNPTVPPYANSNTTLPPYANSNPTLPPYANSNPSLPVYTNSAAGNDTTNNFVDLQLVLPVGIESTCNQLPGTEESRPEAESSVSSSTSKKKSRRRHLNENKRRALLEEDEYLLAFNEKQVVCSGCGRTIKLDGRDRARYYLTFWLNHKARCRGVRLGITAMKSTELLEGRKSPAS